MSRGAAALLAAALAACASTPAGRDTDAAARSLAAAEAAFAAQSVREGMRNAFLAHFAPDGVFVRNAWVGARDFLQDRPDPPIVLDWRPAFVETAASGDFGLSTGPWKLTGRARADAPPAYGQFISIWKREGTGPWRVAVDLGVQHPQPVLWEAPLHARGHSSAPASSTTVVDAEARFAQQSAAHGARAAYAALLATDARVYREGEAPAIGARDALATIEHHPADRQWSVERSEMAASRDFAYALGRYADAGSPGVVSGHFLRVWRWEAHDWRIALEVVKPASS